MRRMFAVLVCTVFVGLLGVLASLHGTYHDALAVQMRETQLRWHTTQVPYVPDSNFTYRSGAPAASAQPIDTTGAFKLWEGVSLSAQQTITDSVTAIVAVVPEVDAAASAGVTIAVDTIQVAMQASVDGRNWVAVTLTQGLTSSQLETSSNDAVYRVIAMGRQAAAGGTAPTSMQLLPYRYGRFIVTGDHAGVFSIYFMYPGPDKYGPYRDVIGNP